MMLLANRRSLLAFALVQIIFISTAAVYAQTGPRPTVSAKAFSCDTEILLLRTAPAGNPKVAEAKKSIRGKIVKIKSGLATLGKRQVNMRIVLAGTLREKPKADLDNKIISTINPTVPPTVGGNLQGFALKYFERRYGSEGANNGTPRKAEMYRIKRDKFVKNIAKKALDFYGLLTDIGRLQTQKVVCENAANNVFPPVVAGNTPSISFSTAGLPSLDSWRGPVTVTALAHASITSVQFTLNGAVVGDGGATRDENLPFSVTLNTAALSPSATGTYELVATGFNAAGNRVQTLPLRFSVDNSQAGLVIVYGGGSPENGIAVADFGQVEAASAEKVERSVRLYLKSGDLDLSEITNVSLQGLSAPFQVIPGGTCQRAGSADFLASIKSNCEFRAAITPNSATATDNLEQGIGLFRDGDVRLNYTDRGSAKSVPVIFRASTQIGSLRVEAEGGTPDFGLVYKNGNTAPQVQKTFTLKLEGSARVSDITITPLSAPFSMTQGCAVTTLTAQASRCDIKVMFAPEANGSFGQKLIINYKTAGGSSRDVFTVMSGIRDDSFEPGSLVIDALGFNGDFGTVQLPHTQDYVEKTFSIKLTSAEGVNLISFRSLEAPYSYSSQCSVSALNSQTSSCEFKIRFTPKLAGTFTKDIIVDYRTNLGANKQAKFNLRAIVNGPGV